MKTIYQLELGDEYETG